MFLIAEAEYIETGQGCTRPHFVVEGFTHACALQNNCLTSTDFMMQQMERRTDQGGGVYYACVLFSYSIL